MYACGRLSYFLFHAYPLKKSTLLYGPELKKLIPDELMHHRLLKMFHSRVKKRFCSFPFNITRGPATVGLRVF
jgi:hypothetical protein